MSSSLRKLLRRVSREPLVHFLCLGVGLFALHGAVAGERERATSTVRVSEAAEAWLVAQFEQREGRAPTAAERTALVERHVDEEVLYREGLALGLDRSDPIVRRRVVQRMQLLLEDLAEPDDAQLSAWFEQHASAYAGPTTFEVEHLFFSGDHAPARAGEAVATLVGGGDASGLGQAFPHGGTARGRSREQLERVFGGELAQAVADARVGEWFVARSGLGWHAVRVESRMPGTVPALEQIRPRVVQDWRRSRHAGTDAAALASLRARYRIDREGTR
jgi:hypothetical protein